MRREEESNPKPEGTICIRNSARQPAAVTLQVEEGGGHDPLARRPQPLSGRRTAPTVFTFRRGERRTRTEVPKDRSGFQPGRGACHVHSPMRATRDSNPARLVLETGPRPARCPFAWGATGFARRRPSREGWNPSRVPIEKVEARGIEPRLAGCKPAVLPLSLRPRSSGQRELNPRPSGPKPDALPLRHTPFVAWEAGQLCWPRTIAGKFGNPQGFHIG
jgi:hypothetical protein